MIDGIFVRFSVCTSQQDVPAKVHLIQEFIFYFSMCIIFEGNFCFKWHDDWGRYFQFEHCEVSEIWYSEVYKFCYIFMLMWKNTNMNMMLKVFNRLGPTL